MVFKRRPYDFIPRKPCRSCDNNNGSDSDDNDDSSSSTSSCVVVEDLLRSLPQESVSSANGGAVEVEYSSFSVSVGSRWSSSSSLDYHHHHHHDDEVEIDAASGTQTRQDRRRKVQFNLVHVWCLGQDNSSTSTRISTVEEYEAFKVVMVGP
mmetsp:Transcript_15057/g.32882  ORF Transcript_15057/g.32882 Transcript_15057/m.32882 type:complete len:152 (-) Transcript_15057:46-501(-)